MIFHIKKFQNSRFYIQNSEQGVTLLLAILILSSVLAISFSLATVLFIEVRTSGDLLKTEGALYAATGVAEQSLFNLGRQICSGNGGSPCYTSSFDNGVTLSGTPSVLTTTSPIFNDVVTPNSSSLANSINKYEFCNASATSTGCGYGKVQLSYKDTGNDDNDILVAYLCEFDPNAQMNTYTTAPCSALGSSQGYWKVADNCSFDASGNGSVTLYHGNPTCSWTLGATDRQQVLVLSNPHATHNIYVQISTFADTGGTVPKGLPYVGKTAIDVKTLNGAVGRRIQISVPNK